MEATAAKIENDRPAPALGNEGNGCTVVSTVLENENIKPCPHRYAGCISQNGYMCTLGGPCDPCDVNGRHFTVSYIDCDGQPLMVRDYVKKRTVVFGIPDGIIDADAALASTPFADAEPFNPAKFVNDVVGS